MNRFKLGKTEFMPSNKNALSVMRPSRTACSRGTRLGRLGGRITERAHGLGGLGCVNRGAAFAHVPVGQEQVGVADLHGRRDAAPPPIEDALRAMHFKAKQAGHLGRAAKPIDQRCVRM